MQVKEAVAIAKKKEPDLTPYYALEQDEQFLLSMLGEDGSPLVNSCVLSVNKKTKECKWVSAFENPKLLTTPILQEYDL